VTPLVDVMLVLLIVFMVAAPLLTVSVTSASQDRGQAARHPTEPITITAGRQDRLSQETRIALAELARSSWPSPRMA
jgi:biopolymer transport protein ExbD